MARRPLDAPRVRLRSEVWTQGGQQVRMWRVVGPTGLEYAARADFKKALEVADKESRQPYWRDAEGIHECDRRGLMGARYVDSWPKGIYCGHGRFIGEGDAFLVEGTPTRLGAAERRDPVPLVRGPIIPTES